MTARQRVLAVGAAVTGGHGGHMLDTFLAQAGRRGLAVTIADAGPALAAAPELAGRAELAECDFRDRAAATAWAAARVDAGERFAAVVCAREEAVLTAAELARAFGVAGNDPEAVHRVRVKDDCREFLRAAGFSQPELRVCTSRPDAADFLSRTRGPWVVKPRSGTGSAGVTRVDGPAELPAALANLDGASAFIVEEFVAGDEFSVEGVFVDGSPRVLALTAKDVTAPPLFVELGHALPAAIPHAVHDELAGTVAKALAALGLRHGLFHVEAWHGPNGAVLGEVHVRPGGDYLHLLLETAFPGLELFGVLLDDALGREPALPELPAAAAAVRYLTAPPGLLRAVHGWPDVCAHPAVVHAELSVAAGEIVPALASSYDRAGAVVVRAGTPEEARALARRLAAGVRFEVTDG
jgi:biotin carboxylase